MISIPGPVPFDPLDVESDDPIQDIKIRPMTPDDMAFIVDSWVKSLDARAIWSRIIPESTFISYHRRAIFKVLERARVSVAVLPDEPTIILGWCCFDPPGILHYVLVKNEFRRRGIATALIAGLTVREYTGQPRSDQIIPKRLFPHAQYNPYRLLVP